MKWIDVNDRLPKDDDEVLCIIPGWDDLEYIRTLSYDPPFKEWSDWNGEIYLPTHWMVLPELPTV